MLWFDAHLDLAYLAVNGRDMLGPLDVSAGPHSPAAVTLHSLAAARVRLVLATIFTEPDGTGPEGYPVGDVERAATVGRKQLAVYRHWHELGILKLDLPDVVRVDPGVGTLRGGMGVAELIPFDIVKGLAPLGSNEHGFDLPIALKGKRLAELGLGEYGLRWARMTGVETADAFASATYGGLARITGDDRLMKLGLVEIQHKLFDLGATASDRPLATPIHAGILIENADPVRSPDELPWWKAQGVVAIGLAWAKSSRYAGGNTTQDGLTSLGKELVRAMDELRIVHDVSHLSDSAFAEVLTQTTRPVIASHSNSRHIMGDPSNQRHLTDEQIREIARRGGVIGVNLYSKFLRPSLSTDARASFDDILRHIDRVCEIAGHTRSIGLGSDMDGGFAASRLPLSIDTPSGLWAFIDYLAFDRGWTDSEIVDFTYGNWTRFWSAQRP